MDDLTNSRPFNIVAWGLTAMITVLTLWMLWSQFHH